MENSTNHCKYLLLKGMVQNTVIEAKKVGYHGSRENLVPLGSLVGEIIVDIIQKRKMDSLLVVNTKSLIESNWFMDILTR